ncbi:hypothetical protein [Mycobacterium sp.]|uniref:hypothetical protein n=1 Tax=Mycobacterium sp. TaxID=1785 RepID=UPI002C4C6FDC|nr:hypothetical protein [Mycobacterium sp.]HTY35378.1 hypothetical protein [Mycobacterium sp.]
MTAPRTSPEGIPLPPRVTSITATTATSRGRHRDIHKVAWLPTEGWWCDCARWTARTSCDHVRAVQHLTQETP